MDQHSLVPTWLIIQQIATLLLQKQSPNSTISVNWVYNFTWRQDALKSRYNRKYDYKRALYEDPTFIRGWFRLIQNTITK